METSNLITRYTREGRSASILMRILGEFLTITGKQFRDVETLNPEPGWQERRDKKRVSELSILDIEWREFAKHFEEVPDDGYRRVVVFFYPEIASVWQQSDRGSDKSKRLISFDDFML